MNAMNLANDLTYGIMDWAVDMDETEGMDIAERMKITQNCCDDLLREIKGEKEQRIITHYMIKNLLEQTEDYILATIHWDIETPEDIKNAMTNAKTFLNEEGLDITDINKAQMTQEGNNLRSII